MQMLSPNPSDVIASDGARCCELSTAGSRAVGGVERSPSHSGLACSWDVCRGRGHGRVLGANCSETTLRTKTCAPLLGLEIWGGMGRYGEIVVPHLAALARSVSGAERMEKSISCVVVTQPIRNTSLNEVEKADLRRRRDQYEPISMNQFAVTHFH